MAKIGLILSLHVCYWMTNQFSKAGPHTNGFLSPLLRRCGVVGLPKITKIDRFKAGKVKHDLTGNEKTTQPNGEGE